MERGREGAWEDVGILMDVEKTKKSQGQFAGFILHVLNKEDKGTNKWLTRFKLNNISYLFSWMDSYCLEYNKV